MTAFSYQLANFDNASDANFRLWGKSLSDSLATVGLVKCPDSGQINWATVAKPVGDTYSGYEIWRFADALQTVNPIFVKIEYGAVYGGWPGIRVQIGRGTNGTGNFVGDVSSQFVIDGPGGSNTTSYISGDPGRISFMADCPASYYYSMVLAIDRTKNSNGTSTSEGVDIATVGYQAGSYFQYFPNIGGPNPKTPSTSPICCAPSSGTGSYAGNIGIYPIMPNMGCAGNPTLNGVVYFVADIPSCGNVISVPIYGVNHNFLTTKQTFTANGNSNAAIGIRYE